MAILKYKVVLFCSIKLQEKNSYHFLLSQKVSCSVLNKIDLLYRVALRSIYFCLSLRCKMFLSEILM